MKINIFNNLQLQHKKFIFICENKCLIILYVIIFV